jgi:hypothetical protein
MARRARGLSGRRWSGDMMGGTYANRARDHRLTPISDSVPMMHHTFQVMLGTRGRATQTMPMSMASMHQRMLSMTRALYC